MTRDELIMRYYDGELDELDAARARTLVDEDADARALLQTLTLVGSATNEAVLAREAPADLTDAIMARVLSVPERAAASALSSLAIAQPSAKSSRRRRPLRTLVAVSGALALAAGFALLIARPNWVAHHQDNAAPIGIVSAREPEPPEQSVAIESVDFGEDPGAIFLVPGESERTIVIWTMDETMDDDSDQVEL